MAVETCGCGSGGTCNVCRDLRSAMIDAMAPEEKILVLEYFQGGDPEGFDEAAREARKRHERAGGYRRAAAETRDDLRQRYADALAFDSPSWQTPRPPWLMRGTIEKVVSAVLAVRDRELTAALARAERAEADLADARVTLRGVRLAARQWAAVDRPLIPLADAGDEPVYAAAGRYILGLLGDAAFLKALDERAGNGSVQHAQD